MVLCDATFEDWPLGERAVAESLQAWSRTGRRMTLLARGYELVSGGTDNHLILIDLTSKDLPGKRAAKALDRAGLETNYNSVPFDPRKPFDPSGLRLGTPSVTSRGMGAAEASSNAESSGSE